MFHAMPNLNKLMSSIVTSSYIMALGDILKKPLGNSFYYDKFSDWLVTTVVLIAVFRRVMRATKRHRYSSSEVGLCYSTCV